MVGLVRCVSSPTVRYYPNPMTVSKAALPQRPRLADHVAARRHRVAGTSFVTLHDTEQARVAKIGQREWTLLGCADGTRDLDGILAAAAQRGRFAQRPHLETFLQQLHQAAMLVDGPRPIVPFGALGEGSDEATNAVSFGIAQPHPDRPLEPLPDYTLSCDGSGTCCRIYPTTIFTAEEATRARALRPELLDGGLQEEQLFTPERGSGWGHPARAPVARCVTMFDGRCAYLDHDLQCSLHGDESTKPLGCRLFPTVFVDDGQVIRVSVTPECTCVFDSIGRQAGTPLVPQGATGGRDLDPGTYVRRLSDKLRLYKHETADRGAYLAWERKVRDSRWEHDVPQRLWALAEAIQTQGLEPRAIDEALAALQPVRLMQLRGMLETLLARLRRRLQQDVAWRSETDMAQLACGLLEQTVERLLSESEIVSTATGAPAQAVETFYVRCLLHGHQFMDEQPLELALRDRAVRLLVARGLATLIRSTANDESSGRDFPDPALRQPLALVEATMRGCGLYEYLDDL